MSESSSIPGFTGLATSYWNFYKTIQIGIPVIYCLQAAPNLISSLRILTPIKTKHGFSVWQIVKLFVSPSLILFCSRAGEHSDLTEKPFSWPWSGQGWALSWAGVRFPACPLASPSILSLVSECPSSSGLKPPQREQGTSSTSRCCKALGQSNSELCARCEVGVILNLEASATY